MNNEQILKYINNHSKYVTINKKKIINFINQTENISYDYWLRKAKYKYSERELIIFAFLCESINFCFWEKKNWEIIYKEKKCNGSELLFHSMFNAVEEGLLSLKIDNLMKFTKNDFGSIMKHNNTLPPLFNKRYKLLKETVNILYKKQDTFFMEIFSVKNDIDLMNYIISNFPKFNDSSKYKNKIIKFNKRAILLCNDLYRLSDTICDNVKSLEHLSGCADYVLPRVFESKGIIIYSEKLLKKIKKERLIKHNSKMEIEIRANTLYALELIKLELQRQDINVWSVELDNIIWKTRNNNDYILEPHHTKTIYY